MNCVNHVDRQSVAFCQVCGRPLCEECVTKIGPAVYCVQDLASKLGENLGRDPYVAAGAAVPPSASAVPPSGAQGAPFGSNAPNPGLAALLGFIPGVGAMYNGQLVKGLIHLGVFAVLMSLADKHDIFALFVAGWIFYQVIEAYQTAVARRDGLPLPNPLGLNDLFGKNNGGTPYESTPGPMFTPGPRDFGAGAGAPPPPPPASEQYAYVPPPPTAQEYVAQEYPPPPPVTAIPPQQPKIPGGAIALMVLGVIFLLGTSHSFWFFHASFVWPLFFIGLGLWIITRRMDEVRYSSEIGWRNWYAYRAVRKGGWCVVLGILWLLSELHVMSWNASWPLLLIFVGVLAVGQHYIQRPLTPYPYGAPPQAPPTPTSAVAGTSIVPANPAQGDEEGR